METGTAPGTHDVRADLLLGLPSTLFHSVGGLAVLLVVQVLNVSSPRPDTVRGWRKQQEERKRREQRRAGVGP